MKIRAKLSNETGQNRVTLCTNDSVHSITIPPKDKGMGSSANGGELLFLSLAACYCNDIYREAVSQGIEVAAIEVEVEGEFGGVGEPARNIQYRPKIKARGGSKEQIAKLLRHTDTVAEVHNTLRQGVNIQLAGEDIEIVE